MKRDTAPAISILLLFVAVLLILGAALFLFAARPPAASIQVLTPAPSATPAPTASPAPILVYVTGAVAHPNAVYTLPYGSRVQDALTAAGGTLPNADLSRLNLAAVVHDGDQIHLYELPSPTHTRIPTLPGTTPSPVSTVFVPAASTEIPLATSNAVHIVRINSATYEELLTLPGIGPVLAERIIEYRTARGRISFPDALMNVRGIGPALVESLLDYISFE
ncbi:MAG: helix-hairpin-helix domain-containing protein [Anaerolineae bacterium]|nr:helix-hairpin-helix domain-containing protein [Anaerolineae bacterium]